MDPRGPANRLIRWSGGVGPLFAAAVLGAVLAIQILAMMRASSSTYDEPAVLASGASYVRTGRIQLETTNYPPLMKYLVGLSLEGAGAQFLCRPGFVEQDRFYACGFEYLYRNSVSPEKILFWGRLPSLLMALALGALIWIWSVRWYGPAGGLFALAMFVFEPNLLAHGGLATMDMGLTAFFFAAFFFLSLFVETGRRRPLILAGAAVGAALATKAPGVLALGAFPACLWWGPSPRPRDPRRLVGAVLLSAGVAALVVVAVYQVRFLPRFFELLKFGVGMGFQKGWRNYLHGQILETGYRYFYPLAFFLKTPLAFGLAAVLSFCRRDRRLVFVVAPVLLYVVIFSLSSKQNGLRYVLPIFPFLCLAMGGVPALFGRWKTPAALLLVGGLAIESVGVAPHYLAYFSPLVGGGSERAPLAGGLQFGLGPGFSGDPRPLGAGGETGIAAGHGGPCGPRSLFRTPPGRDLGRQHPALAVLPARQFDGPDEGMAGGRGEQTSRLGRRRGPLRVASEPKALRSTGVQLLRFRRHEGSGKPI
ncbi:MAG: glycosyltransferase family 39 protein [Elusimicrobia bacterium]|nr:glycosyltransferase family 39 protein [Elusimicrobiota bacterium]